MLRNNRQAVSTLCLIACLVSAACDQTHRPATFPVHGKVTYRGQPVSGASVTFLAPGAPRLATGVTDDQGNFQLSTYHANDGAVPGTHVVTVRKFSNSISSEAQPEAAANAAADDPIDPAAVERSMADSARRLETARSLLPIKYANHQTSDLRKEVVAGSNEINIDLVD